MSHILHYGNYSRCFLKRSLKDIVLLRWFYRIWTLTLIGLIYSTDGKIPLFLNNIGRCWQSGHLKSFWSRNHSLWVAEWSNIHSQSSGFLPHSLPLTQFFSKLLPPTARNISFQLRHCTQTCLFHHKWKISWCRQNVF